jgi:Protein of unknown function (DUF3386)
MSVMTRTLFVHPLQDILLARSLLQRAQGALQKWPEEFAGFWARLHCWSSTREVRGWLQLVLGRRLTVCLPDVALRDFVQTTLERLVDERTPRFFKDGDGRFPLTLDTAPHQTHETRIQVHHQPGKRVVYGLDGAGRLRSVEREAAGLRSVMVFEEFVRTTPGRVLPTRLTTAWFDVASGVHLGSELVSDTHLRLAHVWLPASRQIVRTGRHGTQALRLVLDGHTLLDTP